MHLHLKCLHVLLFNGCRIQHTYIAYHAALLTHACGRQSPLHNMISLCRFNNTGGCNNVGCNNHGTGNVGYNNDGSNNKGDNNDGSNNVGFCLSGSGLTGNHC